MALILAAGCTTSRALWGDPDVSPATKADMKSYVQDSYQCVINSEQPLHLGQLALLKQRDAQRSYEQCMTARGYTVQHR